MASSFETRDLLLEMSKLVFRPSLQVTGFTHLFVVVLHECVCLELEEIEWRGALTPPLTFRLANMGSTRRPLPQGETKGLPATRAKI